MASEKDLELEAQALELEAQARERELELLEGSVTNPSPDFESGKLETPDDPISTAIDYGVAGGIQGAGAAAGAKLASAPIEKAAFSALPKWALKVPKYLGGIAGAALTEVPAEMASGRDLGAFDTVLSGTLGTWGAGSIGKSSANFVDDPANITGPNRTAMAAKLDPGNKLLPKSLQPRMGEFKDAIGAPRKLENAQVTGYLSDVSTPEELVLKLEKDLGTVEYVPKLDPNGKPLKNSVGGVITEPKGVPGRLQQEMDSILEASLYVDDAVPAIPREAIEQRFVAIGDDLKRQAILSGKPEVAEAIEREVVSRIESWRNSFAEPIKEEGLNPQKLASKLFQEKPSPPKPEMGRLSSIVDIRRALDKESNYGLGKNAMEEGSIAQLISKRFADEFRELEELRLKTLAEKSPEGEQLYMKWLEAKNRYHTARGLEDMAVAQGVRDLKKNTDSNAVKDAALAPGSIPSRVLNAVFPKASSENMFKKSQLASGLRGNPAPNIMFSDISSLAKLRRFGNEVGGGAIAGAGGGALRGVVSPDEAMAMNTPTLTETRRFSKEPNPEGAKIVPQIPPLPRDTSQWNNVALAAFLVQTRGMGAEAVGYKLADAYKKAERLGDRSQQERIVADMSKMFPQFFEPGMGVNGKIFHADDQKEYMSKLESAQRKGFLDSVFLAKQRNAFMDRNDLKIIPLEKDLATNLVNLPASLRPNLPVTPSGARVDPY